MLGGTASILEKERIMSNELNVTTASVNGTSNGTPETVSDDVRTARTVQPRELFSTMEEAEANKPAGDHKLRLFRAERPNGTEGYVWAFTSMNAVSTMAMVDGYSAGVAERKGRGPISKQSIADRLASFTDAELEALGLRRAPAAPIVETPAPVVSSGLSEKERKADKKAKRS